MYWPDLGDTQRTGITGPRAAFEDASLPSAATPAVVRAAVCSGGLRREEAGWHCWDGTSGSATSQVASSSSMEKCYCERKTLQEAWPCPHASRSRHIQGLGGATRGGFQSCSQSRDVPPQHTCHPEHCHLFASNPAPDVNLMKNNCLGHRGHFPLLRGGGWTRSQVLARTSQRSHCDWPLWLQQALALPVLLSPCPGHTL